jgi:hypothetical protein
MQPRSTTKGILSLVGLVDSGYFFMVILAKGLKVGWAENILSPIYP